MALSRKELSIVMMVMMSFLFILLLLYRGVPVIVPAIFGIITVVVVLVMVVLKTGAADSALEEKMEFIRPLRERPYPLFFTRWCVSVIVLGVWYISKTMG